MNDYQKYYQRFLKANAGKQHYASHSHHYWPDVTREATIQYWDDAARFVDHKWDYIFSQKIPHAQRQISRILNLPHPQQIVFAPNTHEFVLRLLSCFSAAKPIRILTTDSEFYSFDRQVNRLSEDQSVSVVKIPTEPFATFQERFVEAIKQSHWDMIFFSHVFFNSGYVVQSLGEIIQAVTNPQTLIAIDGYHGFMAYPTDLNLWADRIFYISGSYKYAQGGEGCCFMSVPLNSQHRPQNTGWFAGFSDLSKPSKKSSHASDEVIEPVSYAQDGYRFAGSTMDFSALYRLSATLDLFEKENITIHQIHSHVQKLQTYFLDDLKKYENHFFGKYLNRNHLLMHNLNHHGHFLTFELNDLKITRDLHDLFKDYGIMTDYRGSRWRFGFGLYQNEHIDLVGIRPK